MTTHRRLGMLVIAVGTVAVSACQQKMAEQPAPRPFEQSAMFAYNQSARPLEPGVFHRNQPTDDDPLVAWLTAEGKKNGQAKPSADASFDKASVVPPVGAPTKPENFVTEFPFAMTEGDLKRGQVMYNAICAECHGAAGYANGKVAERGFLRPPSYHTDPTNKEKDWSSLDPKDGKPAYTALDAGYSRGFYRWGQKIAIKDVPIGYIYQVIVLGYGAMGSHDVQLPKPEDRWRVIAYIRALQYSQAVDVSELPKAGREALNQPGEKK